jgi:hypothetical protein
MGTVLILGAGSSLAQAISCGGAEPEQVPPLDRTFFDKLQQLAGTRGISDIWTEFLQIAGEKLYFNPFHSHSPSLERFLSDIYYDVSMRPDGANEGMFRLVLRLFNAVLCNTTNWLSGDGNRNGVLDCLLVKEREGTEDLTVITFNQDLVVENAIFRSLSPSSTWCLCGLYGDVPLQEAWATKGSLFPTHSDKCDHAPPCKVLKLHGSLNWVIRLQGKEPDVSELIPERREDVFVHNLRELPLWLNLTDVHEENVEEAEQGKKKVRVWPIVVPPIYHKSIPTTMSILRKCWNQAYDALRKAERIVVFGYSHQGTRSPFSSSGMGLGGRQARTGGVSP